MGETVINKNNLPVETVKRSLKVNIRQFSMIIALLAIWFIFQILTRGVFISARNLSNLFLQSAAVGIAASGVVLVMVAGHIDLSIGSVVGFTGAVAAVCLVNFNMSVGTALIITLIVGLIIGIWHGFWIAYRGVPAFIVTLASMLMFRGAIIGITGSKSISPNNAAFKAIGQGYLPKLNEALNFHDATALLGIVFIIAYIILELKTRKKRQKYGFKVLSNSLFLAKLIGMSIVIAAVFSIMVLYRGIPYAVLLLIAVVIIFTIISTKTAFGRYVYAIGGNREAARLSGIDIKKTNMTIFVLMGLLSTIAGIVYTSRLNAAIVAAGQNFEMDCIAAAIIGGTSTLGGEGTIPGAIIGALVMASLDNGMSLMNLGSFEQYLVKGLVLLVAVWFDIATRKKAA